MNKRAMIVMLLTACVAGALKPGANELEVRVTTLWPNRMIGDAALPDDVPWNRQRPKGAYPFK